MVLVDLEVPVVRVEALAARAVVQVVDEVDSPADLAGQEGPARGFLRVFLCRPLSFLYSLQVFKRPTYSFQLYYKLIQDSITVLPQQDL